MSDLNALRVHQREHLTRITDLEKKVAGFEAVMAVIKWIGFPTIILILGLLIANMAHANGLLR
jgi:hypothetical protein